MKYLYILLRAFCSRRPDTTCGRQICVYSLVVLLVSCGHVNAGDGAASDYCCCCCLFTVCDRQSVERRRV